MNSRSKTNKGAMKMKKVYDVVKLPTEGKLKANPDAQPEVLATTWSYQIACNLIKGYTPWFSYQIIAREVK